MEDADYTAMYLYLAQRAQLYSHSEDLSHTPTEAMEPTQLPNWSSRRSETARTCEGGMKKCFEASKVYNDGGTAATASGQRSLRARTAPVTAEHVQQRHGSSRSST